jgi:hypothetical protein
VAMRRRYLRIPPADPMGVLDGADLSDNLD